MGEETSLIQSAIDRYNAGDPQALNDLFSRAAQRLQRIASRMLHTFPDVPAREGTGTVVQLTSLNLLRDLTRGNVKLTTAREFFGLSRFKMRRVLIDLARTIRGPEGSAINQVPMPADDPSAGISHAPDKIAALHELNACVDSLPEEQGEVVNLLFYWNLTQDEAAQALGISVAGVKRRWRDAKLALIDMLGDAFLGPD